MDKEKLIGKRVLKSKNLLPSIQRYKKGPVVIVECPEEIPCNPCVDVCPRKAITIEGDINQIPKVDFEKCIGCLLCIPKCPGLAIFVVERDYNKKEALISLPYEFIPRPKKGEVVFGLSREGKKICKGIIERVIDKPQFNRCAVVQVRVKKRYYNDVRMIKPI